VPKDKKSISITIKRSLLEKVEAECERLGISKSAYISMVVAQHVDLYGVARNAMGEGVIKSVGGDLKA